MFTYIVWYNSLFLVNADYLREKQSSKFLSLMETIGYEGTNSASKLMLSQKKVLCAQRNHANYKITKTRFECYFYFLLDGVNKTSFHLK